MFVNTLFRIFPICMGFPPLIYSCPRCGETLLEKSLESDRVDLALSTLECQSCETRTPVVNNFPLFTHAEAASVTNATAWPEIVELFKEPSQYRDFIYRQSLRPVFDPYAAYYPFNEGLLGFTRLVEVLRESLSPGDKVLDLNSRTGWTGELLAALFPEQRVISFWEGNQGALGFNGFNYWLPSHKRAQNLEIAFNADKSKIPFADNTFELIIGFDFLHYHSNSNVLEELVRVGSDKCPMIFPHVHTNHSTPDPFFERGGELISAQDWCDLFEGVEGNGDRVPCVISELEIYTSPTFQLNTKPRIEHYNCCVMFIPERLSGLEISYLGYGEVSDDAYVLVNPLIGLSLDSKSLRVDPKAMDSGVRHLLDRHPMIEQDLNSKLDFVLSRVEKEYIYLARKGLTHSQIIGRASFSAKQARDVVLKLNNRRVISALPISKTMWEFQQYFRFRHTVRTPDEHTFSFVWTMLESNYEDRAVMLNYDGSEFSVEHTRLFVNATRHMFDAKNMSKGDALLICSGTHLEVLVCCWAAWLSGLVVVIANPEISVEAIQSLVRKTNPRLAFTDRQNLSVVECEQVSFDVDEDIATNTFSGNIEPYFEMDALPIATVDQADLALILSTSGSTGKPKHVMLSQGSLYRSAEAMGRCFEWKRGERFLSLGPMYSMSGIRNPAVAAIFYGVSVVVPSPQQQILFQGGLRLVDEFSVNILSTVPAFVENLAELIVQDRKVFLPSLNVILSTASKLDENQRKLISSELNIQVLDYYGLTETGGICISQRPDVEYESGSIGGSVNSMIDVRGENDESLDAGKIGELFIYNNNLFSGYIGSPSSGLTVKGGWLRTGDNAIVLSKGDVKLMGRVDSAVKNRQGEFIEASP